MSRPSDLPGRLRRAEQYKSSAHTWCEPAPTADALTLAQTRITRLKRGGNLV
jgi:hypothetical protein